jgi:hypothetical protein
LVTVRLTVKVWFAVTGETARSVKAKVVYERPWPNGKRGVMEERS